MDLFSGGACCFLLYIRSSVCIFKYLLSVVLFNLLILGSLWYTFRINVINWDNACMRVRKHHHSCSEHTRAPHIVLSAVSLYSWMPF